MEKLQDKFENISKSITIIHQIYIMQQKQQLEGNYCYKYFL